MEAKSNFQAQLARAAEIVNARLERILDSVAPDGERQRPPVLMEAMRHAVLNGGKRLRPFLVLESAALFDISQEAALQTACALEYLHCYSLVHDDLPAMDDDDIRRGKPTVHKAFDEATAILAGDALLTLAFDLLTDPACHPDGTTRAELANLLARASGAGGMIGGQILDLAAETTRPTEDEIKTLQAMKTGALIRYACEAGAVLGGASPDERKNITRFGETIGLAFQLADDLLDVTSNAKTLGKAAGKDADRGKGTLVALYGIEKTRAMLDQLTLNAESQMKPFGNRGQTLIETARFIVARTS